MKAYYIKYDTAKCGCCTDETRIIAFANSEEEALEISHSKGKGRRLYIEEIAVEDGTYTEIY